ncbi:MAG: hypothetical protein IT260_12955 [Saprospiraceae bacterium]|nr:hypothetical protein [Saprospiraceae bacterium]
MADATVMGTPDYTISNIRFETETGGYVTLWYDLGGSAFAEPEAMANMLLDFDEFLQFLSEQHPDILGPVASRPDTHPAWLQQFEASQFHWETYLRQYIHRHVDLVAAERERTGWLLARRARAADSSQDILNAEWDLLSAQAERSPHPSWDEVAHALIASLNDTAVGLYPEMLDFSDQDNAALREIFESHGERLANQLVALTTRVRKEQG